MQFLSLICIYFSEYNISVSGYHKDVEIIDKSIFLCFLFIPFSRCCAVLSPSVFSDSLRPHGQQLARLLCPWEFSRQQYWSWVLFPTPGDLPNPMIKRVSCISCIGKWILYHCATWEASGHVWMKCKWQRCKLNIVYQ